MERELKDKTVQVMKLLYDWNGEVVISISEENIYLFLSNQRHEIEGEVVDILIVAEIIELDSGCEEEGQKREVFILTPESRSRIKKILEQKPQPCIKQIADS